MYQIYDLRQKTPAFQTMKNDPGNEFYASSFQCTSI